MNKGNILTFRLPGDLYRDLSNRAMKEGSTISELARKIITEHARVQEMSRALEEITKKHSAEHLHLQDLITRLAEGSAANKGTTSQDANIAKILLHLSWLVAASPQAAKLQRESGYK